MFTWQDQIRHHLADEAPVNELGHEVEAHLASPFEAGLAGAVTGGDSTSSASFVDLAGPLTFTFTKRFDETRLRLEMAMTFFTTNGAVGARFGMRINSIYYQVAELLQPIEPSVRLLAQGLTIVPHNNCPAGIYTVTGRWAAQSAVAGLQRNADDWNAMSVTEIV